MKTVAFTCAALILLATALSAQTPFEEAHSDIIRKLDIERARAAFERTPLLMPDPTANQLQYDVLHYVMDIAFNPTTTKVSGSVTVTLESLVDGLLAVDLDADEVLTIAAVEDGAADPLPWTRSTDIVTVELPVGLAAGEQTTFTVSYGGFPTTATNTGMFFRDFSGTPVIYSLSEPWGARTWWPCKDYPDDKATFEINLSVPDTLIAASNGTYLGYTEETQWTAPYRRYHWQETSPMAPYLASIAASEYVVLEDYFVYAPAETMPITHYVFPSRAYVCAESFNITVPALEFFSSIFGLYPYVDEKYGKALASLGGGMEHQTLCSYGWWFGNGAHDYDWLFVHELAHQWFGDCITCKDWTHIWLNEGFASYAEALWTEHVDGTAALHAYMADKDNPANWNGPIIRDPDSPDPWYYFDSVVYDKAAWVLHMLRHIVGDSTFFQTLQAYTADPRYRHGVAETADFVGVCEDQYGAPLDWFFDEWLTREDRLTLEWGWGVTPTGDGFDITVMIDQMQAASYTMPVDLRVTLDGAAIDTVLWMDEFHEEYTIALDGPVLEAALDPDHWILCDKYDTTTGERMLPLATRLEQNVPNPFNPATRIRFALSGSGRVSLRVYDVRGRLVTTLADRHFPYGTYDVTWNGTNARGRPVASGVYFCRLETVRKQFTKKMVLLR